MISDSLLSLIFAGAQGLEPRLPGPKPGVLPLDDAPNTLFVLIL